jgi:hypothetical protein
MNGLIKGLKRVAYVTWGVTAGAVFAVVMFGAFALSAWLTVVWIWQAVAGFSAS